MDEALGVDVLDAADELVGEQEDGLEGELAVAEVEEILEGGAEEVEDHGVVVTLGAEPSDERNADAASKRLFVVNASAAAIDVMFGHDTVEQILETAAARVGPGSGVRPFEVSAAGCRSGITP